MSWSCPICEKSFGRKDSMQRQMISKHCSAGLNPIQTVSTFPRKCQQFRFEHPA